MAEEKEQQEPTSASGEDDVISLDDIDSILNQEDPQFSEDMKKIGADETLKSADLEVFEFEDEKVEGDIAAPGAEPVEVGSQKLANIKRLFTRFKTGIKESRARLKESVKMKARSAVLWLRNDFPPLIKKLGTDAVMRLGQWRARLAERHRKIQAIPKKTKQGYFALIALIGVLASLIYMGVKGSWIPQLMPPIVTSLEPYADSVATYDSKDVIDFYRAFPQPEHSVQIEKIVVSLKRKRSYETPMAAIEFYLEMDSQEAAIEIKDREKQVLDVIQRAVEEFTYEDLSSKAGVAEMKAAVRHDVNDLLNQGRVNKVFTKTFVLKP